MTSGLTAALLVLAASAASCSPDGAVRAEPVPIKPAQAAAALAVAGPGWTAEAGERGGDAVPLPQTAEEEEAERAAARARLPTRCVRASCPEVEARWSPEVAPCVNNAVSQEELSNCYADAAWRLDRMLEWRFRQAAATPDAKTARRVSALHAEWRKGLKACRLDVGRMGPESQIDESQCLYSFTIERQIDLERLTGQRPGR